MGMPELEGDGRMDVLSKVTTKHKIWEGAFILTIAALITKLLSALYRIPYQNIAGDIGFYIYQQVYPFYGIALVLSTYGFPVVISKLIAEYGVKKNTEAMKKIIFFSFFVISIFGWCAFSLLYFGANHISVFMGDPNLTPLIKIVSLSFLLLPVISIIRGFFQGIRTMTPTAVSQVTEQSVRVVTILFLSWILISSGYGVYAAAAGAIFGSITGGIAAIFTLAYFLLKKKTHRLEHKASTTTITGSIVVKSILGQGFTICISGLVLVLIQLIDAFSLYAYLLSSGIEETLAKQLKGIYDRGQPLIQLGTVVATSLSLTLVPLITSAKTRNDHQFISEKSNLAIRISLVVGIGASVGLASVIEPTNIMLFKDTSGSDVLFVLAFSILFTSLALTISPILQGLGSAFVSALIVLVGMAIKWGLNYILIPLNQTMGAAIATVLAFLIIAFLHSLVLQGRILKPLITLRPIMMMVLSSIIMAITVISYIAFLSWMFIDIENSRVMAVFAAISGVVIGGVVYIFFILKGKVFSDKELSLIPMGDRLQTFLQTKK